MIRLLRLIYAVFAFIGFSLCSEAERLSPESLPIFLRVVAADDGSQAGRFEAFIEKIFVIDEALRQFRSLPGEVRQETLRSMMGAALDESELRRLEEFFRLARREEISIYDIAQYITKHYQNFRSFQNLDMGELTLFVGTSRLVTIKNPEPTDPSLVNSL